MRLLLVDAKYIASMFSSSTGGDTVDQMASYMVIVAQSAVYHILEKYKAQHT